MIFNIRGTSGSGKSTLVRRVMELYGAKSSVFIKGRKRPICYLLDRKEDQEGLGLAVVGHYESACGGCDTISKMDEIFDIVRHWHNQERDVIFEGLLISADVNRTLQLYLDVLPLLVVGLDKVELPTCLAGVNARRMKRLGPEKYTPVNPKNTESKYKGVKQSMTRLRGEGVGVLSCDRDEGLALLIRELNLA